jgi:hypothetical protein
MEYQRTIVECRVLENPPHADALGMEPFYTFSPDQQIGDGRMVCPGGKDLLKNSDGLEEIRTPDLRHVNFQ